MEDQNIELVQIKPKKGDFFWLHPDQIEVEDGFNCREDMGDLEELANDIIVNGIKNAGHGFTKRGSNKTTLTDGHRRFAALQIAHAKGYTDILFPMQKEGRSPSDVERVLGLITYNKGKNLSLLEESNVYGRLLNYGWSVAEIARRAAKSSTHITNALKLCEVSPTLRRLIIEGKVAATTIIEDLGKNSADVTERKVTVAIAQNEGKKVTKKHVTDKIKQKFVSYDEVMRAIKQVGVKYHEDVNHKLNLQPGDFNDDTLIYYADVEVLLKKLFNES